MKNVREAGRFNNQSLVLVGTRSRGHVVLA